MPKAKKKDSQLPYFLSQAPLESISKWVSRELEALNTGMRNRAGPPWSSDADVAAAEARVKKYDARVEAVYRKFQEKMAKHRAKAKKTRAGRQTREVKKALKKGRSLGTKVGTDRSGKRTISLGR